MKYIRYGLTILIVGLLLSTFGGIAHEDHDHSFNRWSWDGDIERGDKFQWSYEGFDKEGGLTIQVNQDLSEINIQDKLKNDTSFLFSEELFSFTADSDITSLVAKFYAVSFVLPVEYQASNGTKLNYFADSLYEKNLIPMIFFIFNISSVSYTINEDKATIEGDINQLDSNSFSTSTGSFTAVYDVDSGLLNQFQWSDEEGRTEDISRDTSIIEEINFNLFGLFFIFIIPILLNKNRNRVVPNLNQ